MRTIDLNADVGEGAGSDAELIPLVSSANIACGAHAGGEATMAEAVKTATAAGVALGAHPGHDDREQFGRREIALTEQEAFGLVRAQIERLAAIAAEQSATIRYVKPHGALYHQASRDAAIARGVVAAADGLPLLGLPGSQLHRCADALGRGFRREAFADRAYLEDGSLAPRSLAGALLESDQAVIEQAVWLAIEGRARTVDGQWVEVVCDSLCLHGDGDRVVERAGAVRAALESEGVTIQAFA